MTGPTRRTLLKALGATAAVGGVGTAAASARPDDTLRLFGEEAVSGATEVVTQGTNAYVATGDGLAVVDWRNPGRPRTIAEMNVPGVGVWDVKVDGDLLAISSQGAEDDDEDHDHENGDGGDDHHADEIGTHFYDVSDPSDPVFLGTWTELPAGVHNHYLDGDVAYICREFPFDDSALKIVDASDPTDPTLLSEWRVEENHPELDQPTNFLHDVYVQDDTAYLAYWDAGCRVLDVSDPTDPVEVSAFGEAPQADEAPDGDLGERLFGLPGNAHYVQPSPDGDHVYVGAETFDGTPGGIKVFDVTDYEAPEQVARVDPPAVDAFRTSHNFDVTANRLHTSWYAGGVRIYDVTDPANPTERAAYDPEGSSFWTAVRARGFTVASDIGGGVVVLGDDRGARRPPAFDGESGRGYRPDAPGQSTD